MMVQITNLLNLQMLSELSPQAALNRCAIDYGYKAAAQWKNLGLLVWLQVDEECD